MKICGYKTIPDYTNAIRMGILLDSGEILDPNLVKALLYEKEGRFNPFERAKHKVPTSLHAFLQTSDNPIEELNDLLSAYEDLRKAGTTSLSNGTSIVLTSDNITFTKPLDKISVYRDFYAHEKHVAKGFEKRKEPIPEAWYEIPAYYKGATEGFIGPEEEILWPSYTNVLDYELELAIIIAKEGKNIKASKACEHIFGFTILNDISARDIQKKEMAIRLGPAKGKDFCSIIGPVITTIDEFGGKEPDLLMTAKINGEEWSRGQSGDSHFSFSQMIEHVAMDEWVLPGDLMGSGTVGTGCGLELDKWIQEGDVLELEVENIGVLKNKVGKKRK
ncbi:MAG: fumarylacetoacetate hydrolase family protein [Deltaproteobacteria bacterium]|nr:MAG: fumarylacetoacetate hydrolase family protein [Deltaproteobacteria bacterium]